MLEHHSFSFRACADPRDWNVEKIFDGRNVVLSSLGEVLVRTNLSDILVPSFNSRVLHLDFGEFIYRGGHEVDFLAVDGVLRSDLDLFDAVHDVQLGDVQRLVVVDHVRVAQERDIQPTAATRTTSSRAELMTDLAELLANRVIKLSWEGAFTDSSGVRLDDTDDCLDVLRRDAETSADTANRCIR